MPRPYHSPSSIALGMRCRHAWAIQYVDGKRDPDVTWAEIAHYKYDKKSKRWFGKGGSCSSRSRSTALGKEIHATFERWYEPARGEPDWRGLPGKIANSACHLLPHPTRVEFAQIEQSIGSVPLPPSRHAHAPTTALEVHGVLWGGYRDLLVEPAAAEARRLKLPIGKLILNDYKSTASIERYALTAAELRVDVQASLYTVDVCKMFGLADLPARWIYLETKEKRRALAVDTLIELSRAEDTIGPCADLARELDTYTTSEQAPKNPLACSDYGPPNQINCPHAKVNGGTCEVKRSFGALIQLSSKRKKEEITMALTAEQQAKVDAKRAEIAAAKAAKEAAENAEPAEDKSDEGDGEAEGSEVEEAAPPKTAAPVKPATAPAPATTPKAKPAPQSQAATVAALATELAAADKVRDAVLAKLRAAVA